MKKLIILRTISGIKALCKDSGFSDISLSLKCSFCKENDYNFFSKAKGTEATIPVRYDNDNVPSSYSISGVKELTSSDPSCIISGYSFSS
jgi:hypothetical protein